MERGRETDRVAHSLKKRLFMVRVRLLWIIMVCQGKEMVKSYPCLF